MNELFACGVGFALGFQEQAGGEPWASRRDTGLQSQDVLG